MDLIAFFSCSYVCIHIVCQLLCSKCNSMSLDYHWEVSIFLVYSWYDFGLLLRMNIFLSFTPFLLQPLTRVLLPFLSFLHSFLASVPYTCPPSFLIFSSFSSFLLIINRSSFLSQQHLHNDNNDNNNNNNKNNSLFVSLKKFLLRLSLLNLDYRLSRYT